MMVEEQSVQHFSLKVENMCEILQFFQVTYSINRKRMSNNLIGITWCQFWSETIYTNVTSKELLGDVVSK